MKIVQKLKIILLISLIVLISLLSFGGIWIQNKGRMHNLVNDFMLGRDLKGGRYVTLELVEDDESSDKEEEKPGKDEFVLAKNIIDKRLSNMKVEDYLISLDEKTGLINIQLPENDITDYIIEFSTLGGVFTVEDEEGNVLLDNSNINKVKTMYGQVSTSSEQGVKVFLRVQFNDESIEKLKEISTTYVESKDEEGKDTSKKVVIKLDDSTLAKTSFEKEITDGHIELAVGSTTNSSEKLQSYLQQASYLEKILNLGKLPAKYEVTRNYYIASDITTNIRLIAITVMAVIILAITIYLIIKYKKMGIIISLSSIGYIAVLLLIIRYTNVILTIDGVMGIVISTLLNYIICIFVLERLKATDNSRAEMETNINKGIINGFIGIAPIGFIALILCFSKWSLIYSFGMITFWGIVTMVIYNIIITKNLLLNFRKD